MLLETFQPATDPLGAPWLSALVAALPVVAMLVTLGALRWKAHHAGPFSWLLAFVVAVTAFGMPWTMALSTSVHGFVYGIFPIIWILVTAIWMYEVTVTAGRFDDLRRTFFLISDDPRVLGLLIAFCFGGLLEALAGFGAPVAITAAMLVAIGFSPLRSALIALLANTVPVAFGAVGLPVLMAAKSGGFDDVLAISPITGRMTALLCLVVPILLLSVMDGKRGIKECWPFGLVVGISFGVTKWVASATAMYSLTEVFAAVISVAVAIVFLKLWHPRGGAEATGRIGSVLDASVDGAGTAAPRPADAPDAPPLTAGKITMALVPYLLVIVVFGIAALPPVKAALGATDLKFSWPLLGDLLDAAGNPSAHQNYTLAWASTPGILLAFVAITTGLIYRLTLPQVFAVLWTNVKKMRFAMLTIGSVVALAYVMGDSGQTLALGMFFAGAGLAYPFVAPVLGWIGTYVTGSDTSANILFSGLQSGVGAEIGPGSHLAVEDMQALLVGANAAGGVVGKMISPQSLTIAATAIGAPGSESVILRRIIGWSFILLFLLCLLSGLMSTPVLSWLLP
ncbi:L-lactate permease [Tessaracoccus defluvii]|uniref:L-lactate permease n=1 Tax=Tessaracoccus defluvii TaxID=1285901 RepID=UPI0031DC0646